MIISHTNLHMLLVGTTVEIAGGCGAGYAGAFGTTGDIVSTAS